MVRPYINLNICDNTPGCPAISACPKDAIYYDFKLKKLLVNDNECKGCEVCTIECDYGAIEILEDDKVKELHSKEQAYGISQAQNIAQQYGIEPTPIIEKDGIEQITSLENLKDDIALVYVFGIWKAESYIGYAFLKEMVQEINKDVPQAKIAKMDYVDYKRDLEELPAFLILKNSQIVNSYFGIKNPLYFAPTLIEDLKNISSD